jgi:hypothetical protein
MKQNLGSLDRVLRGLGALAMIVSGVLVPAHEAVRLGLGLTGVYLAFTALAGSCLGYRLMGRSTCPLERG